MRPEAVICVLCLALGDAASAHAQVIRGRLLDLESGDPIPSATLTLIRDDGERLATTITGSDGSYILRAPRAGAYYVEAKRIGYRLWIDGPIELRAGDDWTSEFRLRPLPVELDPVEIRAAGGPEAARHLARVGFFERQRSDFGYFLTREDIERRQPRRLTDVLGALPGTRPVFSSSGGSQAGLDVRGSRLSQGGPCHPRVFVDGLVVIRGDARPRGETLPGEQATEVQGDRAVRSEISLNDVVMPDDVQAIEVYRSAAQVPVRFGGASMFTQCGVIVIWTRHGRGARR